MQIINGTLDEQGRAYYVLPALRAGQSVYARVQADNTAETPHLAIGRYAYHDPRGFDKPEGTTLRSEITYEVPITGDYSLTLTHPLPETHTYRLTIGIDAPNALQPDASATGETLAHAFAPVQRLLGRMTDCSRLQNRPEFSGPVLRREHANFIVHYTTQGRDAATEAFVDAVVAAVASAWAHHMALGWPAPPPDCGEGGDTRYDVYLKEILRNATLGSAMRQGILLDHPNTPELEQYAAYSALLLDNDFISDQVADPLGVMRATVAHELMHSIQFGYDFQDAYFGIYESSATWVETQTFPEDQDATRYVDVYFANPDRCLGYYEHGSALRQRIYAEWLLVDTLIQQHGVAALQRIWQNMIYGDGLATFYSTLAEYDLTPQELVLQTAVRNLLLDYPQAADFGDQRVRVEALVNGLGTVTPRRNGVQPLGVDYVLILNAQRYTLSIEPQQMHLYLVGIHQEQASAYLHDLGQRGTVDTSAYDYSYILILNTAYHLDIGHCAYQDWALQVARTNAPETPALPAAYNATQFVPAG